jgi:5'-3' exonuclease
MIKNDTLIIIDGFNLLSRCYFATSYGKEEHQLPKNKDGLYTNALRVKLQKLLNLIEDYDATHLVIAWDVKREETKRRQQYEDYKGTRGELPTPLIQQFETVQALFDRIGVPQLTVNQYEADDIMGVLSNRWSAEGRGKCYIYSNDRDLLQLLNEDVSQIIAAKKSEKPYSIHHFKEQYGIEPRQWIDVKALLGDKSDNIPGVHGVGEKAALPLIQQYGSVERIYAELDELDPKYKRYLKKLQEGKEMAMLSKELVEIYTDIPDLRSLHFDDLQIKINHKLLKEEVEKLELRIKIPV